MVKEWIGLGLVAMLGVCGVSRADDPPAKALYQQRCVFCHGKLGEGNPQMAAMFKLPPEKTQLTISKLSSADAAAVIRSGRRRMPAFKDLTDAQIQQLADYLQTLKSAKSAEPKP